MRLVANRLFLERSLQEAITDFAASKLRELLPAPKQPVPALMAGNPGSANGADHHPLAECTQVYIHARSMLKDQGLMQ